MRRSAAVAVIGGGVIGASVAYHLAKHGMRDVVIVDGAPGPGHGSTGSATGGFRAQFATPVNVRLSLASRDSLLRFLDDTGVDPGYSQVGYLWLASSDSHLSAIREAQAVQLAQGLSEAQELTLDEIVDVNPHISLDGIVGAAFCPTDGYIRPLEILRGYLEAGERLGVEAIWNTEVSGFEMAESFITRIRTSHGEIEAGTIVNAAGPWAATVAALAGVDLPVTPLRRQAAVTRPTDAISPEMPMTIFMDTGFHLRAREGRAVLCWPNPDDGANASDLIVDDAWIESVVSMAQQRVPALGPVFIDRERCYAGLYEMSPDHHAIVGHVPECENMFLVNGSSGHGVMHSPALGAIAAEMICGGEPTLDVRDLRPSRFAEGAPIDATELL